MTAVTPVCMQNKAPMMPVRNQTGILGSLLGRHTRVTGVWILRQSVQAAIVTVTVVTVGKSDWETGTHAMDSTCLH